MKKVAFSDDLFKMVSFAKIVIPIVSMGPFRHATARPSLKCRLAGYRLEPPGFLTPNALHIKKTPVKGGVFYKWGEVSC